jgi:hypothetical protein
MCDIVAKLQKDLSWVNCGFHAELKKIEKKVHGPVFSKKKFR